MENLFKAVGCDGSAKKLTSNDLDEILALLNDTTCGTNILYCENPKASLIFPSVFKNGVQLTSDSPDYDKKGLFYLQIQLWTQLKISKNVTFLITW